MPPRRKTDELVYAVLAFEEEKDKAAVQEGIRHVSPEPPPRYRIEHLGIEFKGFQELPVQTPIGFPGLSECRRVKLAAPETAGLLLGRDDHASPESKLKHNGKHNTVEPSAYQHRWGSYCPTTRT